MCRLSQPRLTSGRKDKFNMIPVTIDFEAHGCKFDFKVHERAMSMVEEIINERKAFLLGPLGTCESPVEQIMFLAMEELRKIKFFANEDSCIITQQVEIKPYRVDFLIDVVEWVGDKMNILGSVIVECDGHDFHEKTKEQAAKDKSRDRFLHSKGYTVLRFTGSEIWNDPFKCAEEAFNVLNTRIKDQKTHY